MENNADYSLYWFFGALAIVGLIFWFYESKPKIDLSGWFKKSSTHGSGTGSTPASGKKESAWQSFIGPTGIWAVPLLKFLLIYLFFAGIIPDLFPEFWEKFTGSRANWSPFGFLGNCISIFVFAGIISGLYYRHGLAIFFTLLTVAGILLHTGYMPGIKTTPAGGDAGKEEVEIIVTNLKDGTTIYRGTTPWKGGANFPVDVEVVCSTAQQGKSVRVSCSYWGPNSDVFLVACGQGKATFPRRHEGNPVVVSAVK